MLCTLKLHTGCREGSTVYRDNRKVLQSSIPEEKDFLRHFQTLFRLSLSGYFENRTWYLWWQGNNCRTVPYFDTNFSLRLSIESSLVKKKIEN